MAKLKELTKFEINLLAQLSSVKLSLIFAEQANNQFSKDAWFLIIYYINQEDELMRWLADVIAKQEKEVKLEIEQLELEQQARDKERKFQDEIDTVHLRERMQEIELVQQLIAQRTLTLSQINQILAEMRQIMLSITKKNDEIRVLLKERDEKTIELMDEITQDKFKQIEIHIDQDPRKLEKQRFLEQLIQAHEQAKQYREQIGQFLKNKGIEATNDRVLHEKLLHAEHEYNEMDKKILDWRLLPESVLKEYGRQIKTLVKRYDDRIEQKRAEVVQLEKKLEENVEKLNEKVKELKENDRESNRVDKRNDARTKDQYKKDTNLINSFQNLTKDANAIVDKIDKLDYEINEEEAIALASLNEAVTKLNNNSNTTLENLVSLVNLQKSIMSIKNNPALWSLVSSLSDKLTTYLLEEKNLNQTLSP